MNLRIAPIAFAEAVATLLRDSGLPTADLVQGARVDFLGAHDGQALSGCVALEDCGDALLLRSLAVARQRRGEGLGRALVEAAEQHARARGHAAVYLLTTDAHGFFAARGYRELARSEAPAGIARTAQFSGLCPASSHFMGKAL
ncbi:arsenic resistance N-acetyltransferase ArsN2 [Pseudoxanthomonas suwonensis]|uniref:arsenic resistance N-acetyltransferase ArsN2 n=1 Tax=Pseudoxanthomonas suwonensis TaxID=314722 RepID=UPI0004639D34|nr:arsenic resistance N-acetyltransferase ArsN2 [Pseudoxanthomonas suwonensis]